MAIDLEEDTTATTTTDVSAARDYDAIVIGSGIGGLTTASILAQLGKKRVLVVERHFKLGGFTHSFRRGDYEWDAGVHYVGGMQPGMLTRQLMDLVTRGGVQWHKMNSPFERFMFPGESFDVRDDVRLFREDLIWRFPREARNIRRYFRDLKNAQHWTARWFISKLFGRLGADVMQYFGSGLAGMTTGDYMDQRFDDPLLKAILTAQWPDFGVPPQESAFGFHATVSADFHDGGFFPVGGAKEIAKHASAAITAHGGTCLVNCSVQEIRVTNGRASGIVALHKGREVEFRAPLIISNAGAVNTFTRMVPDGCCEREREQAARIKPGPSSLVLFLGLNDDPRKHGFTDTNYWLYSRLDHDTQAKFRENDPERVDGAFLSFCSLRNPGQEPHTAQIVTLDDYQLWQAHGDKAWRKRGADYELRKDAITDRLLSFVEARLPGVRKLIAYQELSTPLTVKTFTDHPGGAIYGQACNADRLFRDRWMIASSLPNLFLTGSDVGTPGVNGALVAGAMTAAKVLGWFGLPRVMTAAYSR